MIWTVVKEEAHNQINDSKTYQQSSYMKFVFHIILSLPELSTGQGGPDVLSCPALPLTRTGNYRTAGQDRKSCPVLSSV
jgi:hypothetical protein